MLWNITDSELVKTHNNIAYGKINNNIYSNVYFKQDVNTKPIHSECQVSEVK